MRIASAGGRLVLAVDGGWVDVEQASGGRFGSDPQTVYDQWADFGQWARGEVGGEARKIADADLDCPVPRPRQVFGIGLNYRDHAEESGQPLPEHPVVFTKFPSSLAGPRDTVTLPSDGVDWEVELVVVIGTEGHEIPAADGWSHVAGLTVGQDLSWRKVQLRPPAPQFSLGKSYPGFSPIGPYVVTPDEVPDKDDLGISCALDGETLQDGRTGDLIFSVPELIARLSEAVTFYPGDLIFTGTPAGVGAGRTPRRFLTPGTLTSAIEGVGELAVTLVAKEG